MTTTFLGDRAVPELSAPETCASWCATRADRKTDPVNNPHHAPNECSSDVLDLIVGANAMNPEWNGHSGVDRLDGWRTAVDTTVQREPDGSHIVAVLLGRAQVDDDQVFGGGRGSCCMEGDFVELTVADAARLRDQLAQRIEQAEQDAAVLAEHQRGRGVTAEATIGAVPADVCPAWCNDHDGDSHRHVQWITVKSAEGEDLQMEVAVSQFAPSMASWVKAWREAGDTTSQPEVGALGLELDGLPHPSGTHAAEDIPLDGALQLAQAITEVVKTVRAVGQAVTMERAIYNAGVTTRPVPGGWEVLGPVGHSVAYGPDRCDVEAVAANVRHGKVFMERWPAGVQYIRPDGVREATDSSGDSHASGTPTELARVEGR